MNRRGFIGLLGAAVASAAYDKERLLWVPGKKLISIPISIPKPVTFRTVIHSMDGRWAVDVEYTAGTVLTLTSTYSGRALSISSLDPSAPFRATLL